MSEELLLKEIYEQPIVIGNLLKHGELTQVAESATQMRKDLINLGVKPYKNHRIYGIDV